MKKPTILLVIVLIGLSAVIYFINKPTKPIACTQEAKLCPDGSAVGRTGPNCEFAPCPSAEKNIQVISPKPGETITSPLVIVGEAREFESAFNFRIKDWQGNILADGYSSANAPDVGQYGPFSVSLNYRLPLARNGTVEVFARSAKDGAEIDLVSVPIIFPTEESQLIKVFFANEKAGPGSGDCARLFPVVRAIPKTTAVAQAALNELLKGPSGAEQFVGYSTNINPGTVVQKLTIVKGVAKVDFSSQLSSGVGGSCPVAGIRDQITNTLKQFPSVKSVQISVNGSVGEF